MGILYPFFVVLVFLIIKIFVCGINENETDEEIIFENSTNHAEDFSPARQLAPLPTYEDVLLNQDEINSFYQQQNNYGLTYNETDNRSSVQSPIPKYNLNFKTEIKPPTY